MRGLLFAAPSSSSGKTSLTAAILRAFVDRGASVLPIKVGPDYIDSQFLSLASKGGRCLNLDLWAMSHEQVGFYIGSESHDFAVAEGVMGLFDGGKDGRGSSADVASLFGWSVILIIDVAGQGESIAAVIKGMREFRTDIHIGGVIFNRLRSASHGDFLQEIMARHHSDLPILGMVEEMDSLQFASRHLGLKQAVESSDEVDMKLQHAAAKIATQIDLPALRKLAAGNFIKAKKLKEESKFLPTSELRHIAIAKDEAFSFIYQHHLDHWHKQGVAISYFSPLRDEAPLAESEMIFLPGGYPELHAKTISQATNFKQSLHEAAAEKLIYAECGGYMVLGDSITDFHGATYDMLGFFRLETSFSPSARTLGYRTAELLCDNAIAKKGTRFKAHEFHHARITSCGYENAQALWHASDSLGKEFCSIGHCNGNISGSFLHIISL